MMHCARRVNLCHQPTAHRVTISLDPFLFWSHSVSRLCYDRHPGPYHHLILPWVALITTISTLAAARSGRLERRRGGASASGPGVFLAALAAAALATSAAFAAMAAAGLVLASLTVTALAVGSTVTRLALMASAAILAGSTAGSAVTTTAHLTPYHTVSVTLACVPGREGPNLLRTLRCLPYLLLVRRRRPPAANE